MANDNLCVFCGEKLGMFQITTITCGGTYQPCCKACYKELKDLNEVEQCRRALRLGLVGYPEKLEKHIEIATNSEKHRPTCLRCGTKLRFLRVQNLDNSPLADGLFSNTFAVLPAYCENCGRYEFYDPDFVEKNDYLVYLIKQDKAE